MPVLADTRVLPQELKEIAANLRAELAAQKVPEQEKTNA
jgi:hypothetical protein